MSTARTVSDLSQQCWDEFSQAMAIKNNTEHQDLLTTKLDSFKLWADNVGAQAEPLLSLDSRLHSWPDDLDLVKSLLNMLSKSIQQFTEKSEKGHPITGPLENMDFVINKLARIGVAIRRAGKASRDRRVYKSFNPDDHHEFKRHLECLILLRPNEDQPQLSGLEVSSVNELMDGPSTKSSEKHDVLKTKIEQLAKSRMDELDSSRLNEIQKRLIDANLRRRHSFLEAQKHSQRLKRKAQPKMLDQQQSDGDTPKLSESGLTTQASAQCKTSAPLENENRATKSTALPAVTSHIGASTVEGSVQLNLHAANGQQRVSSIARSQISLIATDTEFPKPPAPFKYHGMFKCPCCCQSLPSEDFARPDKWRQHLIEDLCPYTCIVQPCPTPDVLFMTRKAWEYHFYNEHLTRWRCQLCDENKEPFSSKEDLIEHTLAQHEQDLSKYDLSFVLSNSEVLYMEIESCPLCPSHGPRDATKLVDHVVRHAYEFALRAFPWPQSVVEDLNRPVGTFSLPEDGSHATHTQLVKWLDSLETPANEISVSSFDKMDHAPPEKGDGLSMEDYFANNDYFEDRDSTNCTEHSAAQEPSSTVWNGSLGKNIANHNNLDPYAKAGLEMYAAAERGEEDTVRSLIRNCLRFDDDGEIRKGALMAATTRGHMAIVNRLLRSALFFATARNDMSMARYLIKSGIDVHSKNHDGLTALHVAIQKGNKDIISLLFTLTAYQKFTDDQGQEASLWAREKGCLEAAQILTELQEKHKSVLSRRAQETVNIGDRAIAAETVIRGQGWPALIDPLLEPLYFDLVGTLPQRVATFRIAYSRDGKYIATGDDIGNAYVFDAAKKRLVFKKGIEVKALIPSPVCFSPDGRSFIFASSGLVQVCDIAKKTVQRSLNHKSGVSALDISNDGRLLASGDFCGTVHIWEQGGKTKQCIEGNGYIYEVKISQDSCFVAATCDDGYAYTWNLKTGGFDAKYYHGTRVRSVAFSSDGKFLVTGGDSGFKVWSRDTGACQLYSEPSGSALTALSMTPDDKWIVTASNRGSIRFWDRATGKSHCIADAHKEIIYSIAFKPGGGSFTTVSKDKTARIWSYGSRRQT
ncbi:hypothetical protein J3F84DRAFT_405364 [Trichoderma pleuroticola]